MAINMELLEKFRMKETAGADNLKNHIGEFFIPEKWDVTDYVDADGKPHNVLAISTTGNVYRTEVAAFINRFGSYAAVFGEVAIEERPFIKVTGRVSKRKNDYISFTLCDSEGKEIE